MDDLVTWLRAQLDDDERVARAAAEPASAEWFSGAEGSVFAVDSRNELHIRGAVLSLDDIGEHIARWDPARVLAEVDAKRKLLELYLTTVEDDELDSDAWTVMLVAVRTLALPYAGRDGWREEWRP